MARGSEGQLEGGSPAMLEAVSAHHLHPRELRVRVRTGRRKGQEEGCLKG